MNTPFVFSKVASVCPCGEHRRFYKLTSHTSGGKCWTCNKFFAPVQDKTPYTPRSTFTEIKPKSRDAPEPTTGKKFVREHIYWNEAGDNYLMKIMIYKDDTGKKHCYQYKWEGAIEWNEREQRTDYNGKWIPGIEGVRLTLYNAAWINVFRTSKHRDEFVVYIVEGEKDAESIWHECGELAVCSPMGAGKWKNSYSELLRGLNCIILPDNDEAGAQHAQMVYDSLKGIANKVRIVNLTNFMPDLPHKGDVTDFFERGGKL